MISNKQLAFTVSDRTMTLISIPYIFLYFKMYFTHFLLRLIRSIVTMHTYKMLEIKIINLLSFMKCRIA